MRLSPTPRTSEPGAPSSEVSEDLRLTFILPTRNRRQWVGRAIESCLRCHQRGVRVEVLVLDGNSTDGSFEALQLQFGADARVRLMRREGDAFMPGCFQALPQVQTPFATFMYDDDVLSPFWVELPRELGRRSAGFVLGFGAEGDIAQTLPFTPVEFARRISPSALLRAYCGWGHELSRHGLPVSPIACLTRTEWLHGWKVELEQFTRGRPLRNYFMMQRNAGPDLLIYFYSILNHTADITVFDEPVAQFSTHSGSLTGNFEATDLPIGYWLAHVWLCDRLRALGRRTDAGWCAAYTFKQGLRLIFKRLRRGHWPWLGSLVKEVIGIAGRSVASASWLVFMKGFLALLLPRRWRPGLSLPPRTPHRFAQAQP